MTKNYPSKEEVGHSTESAKGWGGIGLGISLILLGSVGGNFLTGFGPGFQAGLVSGVGIMSLIWGVTILLRK